LQKLLRSSHDVQANAAATVVSISLSLYAVEAALVFGKLYPNLWHQWVASDHKQTQSSYELARAAERESYPAFPPFWYFEQETLASSVDMRPGDPILPLAGPRLAEIVFCNEGDKWIRYQSDRHGFRNPDAAWDRVVDTILIGDSFAEGQCVDGNDTIAGRLRAMGHSVVTLGRAGRGPLEQFAVLREYVETFQPKFVVWLFYEGNDLIPDLAEESLFAPLHSYLDPAHKQFLMDGADAADHWIKKFGKRVLLNETKVERGTKLTLTSALSALRLVRIRTFLSNMLSAPSSKPITVPQGIADTYKNILSQSKRLVSGWGGSLNIVYLPTYNTLTNGNRYQNIRSTVLGAARQENIQFIDPTAALRALGEKAFVSSSSHYSPIGYAAVARMLEPEVKGK